MLGLKLIHTGKIGLKSFSSSFRRNGNHHVWQNLAAFWVLTHLDRVTHICVSKLTIIDSEMACHRRHYLNQCWNIVNSTSRNKILWNLNRNSYVFIQDNAFENIVCKMVAISSRPQCVSTTRYNWCLSDESSCRKIRSLQKWRKNVKRKFADFLEIHPSLNGWKLFWMDAQRSW